MEGLLFGLGAVFGVFLWEFLGAMLEKREARIKGVKSTTLSDVKMISLPECDYNEMEDTIEEQKKLINELKEELRLNTTIQFGDKKFDLDGFNFATARMDNEGIMTECTFEKV